MTCRNVLLIMLIFAASTADQRCRSQGFPGGEGAGVLGDGDGNRGNGNLGDEAGNSQGGGSFADFDSLMSLIQTIVAPETWEELGGPSSMSPYPQGVYVDASGTLHEIQRPVTEDAARQLKSLLQPTGGAAGNWKNPSPLRFVSLHRLFRQLDRIHDQRTTVPASMNHLAGLSQVQYVFLTAHDLILAGPVGGIETKSGWYRDRQSGRAALRLDFFVSALAAAQQGQPFGCTIDPTAAGLQAAMGVARQVKNDTIPIGLAADELSAALGMQRIEVFGIAGDTPIGYVMVEADRHMKQLALGMHPMPNGARNYLDVVEQSINQGPPDDLLLRLWFTSQPRWARSDAERTVFELAGVPIRLSGQNERALASGRRGQWTVDARTSEFVDQFNDHWSELRSRYPIYAALESIFQAAAAAECLNRHATDPAQRELIRSLAGLPASAEYLLPTPRQVRSIAVLHQFRRGTTRHQLLIASGGVSVNAAQSLVAKIHLYPALRSIANPAAKQPQVIQRWWWDRP